MEEQPLQPENEAQNRRKPWIVVGSTTAVILLLSGAVFVLVWGKKVSAPAPLDTGQSNTTTNTNTDFTFAAAGDFDSGNNFVQTLTSVKKAEPNFMLALGDFSYGNTTESDWCDIVKSQLGKHYPFELLVGNHDTDTGTLQNQGFIDNFTTCLPNRIPGIQGTYGKRYFFDYNNIARFIMISPDISIKETTYSYDKGTANYRWTKKAIENARAQGIKWVVVGMHKNCLTIGQKKCEIGTDIEDLLVSEKVDMILQGHEHGYMRTKQLALSDNCTSIAPDAFNSACLASSDDNSYQSGQGTVLVIAGTGGKEVRNIELQRKGKPYFAAWSGNNVNPAYGPLLVNVSNTSLQASFTSNAGKKIDNFSIQK